jgi:hypothetical protein
MKTKSLIFLISVLLVLSTSSFGQEKGNASLPKIGSQTVGKLYKASGWLLNPEGQWISRQNKIPCDLPNQMKALIDYGKYSPGIDNFISYELREVSIQDSSYYILIKKYNNGYYHYSTQENDWQSSTEMLYYVFNKPELEKLKNIEQDSINFINIHVRYFYPPYSAPLSDLSEIEKDLAKQMKETNSDYHCDLVLFIVPCKTKNIVQFQIYSILSQQYPGATYTTTSVGGIIKQFCSCVSDYTEDNVINGNDKAYLSKKLFKSCYFESDYTTFRNFLKID